MYLGHECNARFQVSTIIYKDLELPQFIYLDDSAKHSRMPWNMCWILMRSSTTATRGMSDSRSVRQDMFFAHRTDFSGNWNRHKGDAAQHCILKD